MINAWSRCPCDCTAHRKRQKGKPQSLNQTMSPNSLRRSRWPNYFTLGLTYMYPSKSSCDHCCCFSRKSCSKCLILRPKLLVFSLSVGMLSPCTSGRNQWPRPSRSLPWSHAPVKRSVRTLRVSYSDEFDKKCSLWICSRFQFKKERSVSCLIILKSQNGRWGLGNDPSATLPLLRILMRTCRCYSSNEEFLICICILYRLRIPKAKRASCQPSFASSHLLIGQPSWLPYGEIYLSFFCNLEGSGDVFHSLQPLLHLSSQQRPLTCMHWFVEVAHH